jgi:DNA-binding response OmpR family regulator
MTVHTAPPHAGKARPTLTRCPTCGQECQPERDIRVDFANNLVLSEAGSAHVPSRIADIIHILVHARPAIQSMDQLLDQMDGWRREPTDERTIRVFLSRANKILIPLGYSIENIRKCGWRLERISSGAPHGQA